MFHYLEFESFCHATEDIKKVKKSVYFLMGNSAIEISEETSLGYYKNPINILRSKLTKNQDIKNFFTKLKEFDLITTISDQLENRLDDDLFLNIRFNKQEAFNENFVLSYKKTEGGVISIKGKVKAFPMNRENALVCVKNFLQEL